MTAQHELILSSSSTKAKQAVTEMQLPVTPEQKPWSSSESSDAETTPTNKPISPRSPTLENLTFDALSDEVELSPVHLHDHMDNVPSSPRTQSPEYVSSETTTPVSVQRIQDDDEDSMEGVETSGMREESPGLDESQDTEMSDKGDLSDHTLTQKEEEESASKLELDSQAEASKSGSDSHAEQEVDDLSMEAHTLVEKDSQEAQYSEEQKDSFPTTDFCYKWLGTSQFSIDGSIILQQEGELDLLASQRAQVLTESEMHPYDPTPLLTLAYLDNRLGFSDVAVSNCHRALLLINAAFNIKLPTMPLNLGSLAQKAVSIRLNTMSITLIGDELLALRLQAYTTMVTGLAGCTAFWEGLKQCKLALKMYPGDHKLLQLEADLNDGLEQRGNTLPDGMDKKTRSTVLKTGKLYQRPYPWLDPKLFRRSKKLLREVNAELPLQRGNLEVRCAFFGPNAESDSKVDVGEGEDIGPLGLFAKTDIEKGELVMVDKSITGVSQCPPSSFQVCDACHACLSPPYADPSQIIKPSCCKAVAYCGRLCYETAMKSYHPLLCGRDFTWLYQNVKMEGQHKLWRRWRAVCFLRIIAIIITSNSKLPAAQRVHPLAHPLVARMTAAYSPNTLRPNNLHDWQFLEEVTIPTRILIVLGIDIFTPPFYSQEVIQTIYWRCENNANQTRTHLNPGQPEVNMVNINTSYLFFNHSCIPNVHWQGPPNEGSIQLERGVDGEFLRPGESAVWCLAVKNIKKGEQCTISYIGDPLGKETEGEGRALKRSMLSKWCEEGCGCRICEEENNNEEVVTGEGVEGGQREMVIGGEDEEIEVENLD